MRLEGRNLYVTGAELDRISALKEDADALVEYLGPDTCAAIQREVGLGPDGILDSIAPWRRWLSGLTIVVESMPKDSAECVSRPKSLLDAIQGVGIWRSD